MLDGGTRRWMMALFSRKAVARRVWADAGCAGGGTCERLPGKITSKGNPAMAPEIHVRAGKWPDSVSLLAWRMAALHIGPGQVTDDDRPLFDAMQRRCALCNSRDRCKHDLSTVPHDDKWQTYCANREALCRLSRDAAREKD
jgi:hypothetical protein